MTKSDKTAAGPVANQTEWNEPHKILARSHISIHQAFAVMYILDQGSLGVSIDT
ncbi:hypothetical protein Lepto7375DRAFT_3543 [Leptolyngbya sp. PCC 7375]|nr:hypothetical protein Lepto7375DRAFT_3543 [Leptolyngbya sp. PCC 7375]